MYLSRCAVKAALNEMEQVIDQESGGDAVPGTPIDGRGIPLISDAGNTESALMKRFKDLNKKKLVRGLADCTLTDCTLTARRPLHCDWLTDCAALWLAD